MKCMCHQIAEDFFHPLLSEFLMLWFLFFWGVFCEVGRGAFSCCLHCTPISSLIYYLWRAGTQMPTNTHSPIFDFLFFQPHIPNHVDLKELLTGLSAVTPSVLGVSATTQLPLTSLTPLPPPPPPSTAALTPGLSRLQVSRGHEGASCCTEQLKQIWPKKSRMAPAGSASSTSPATSSFATTSAGYATSMSASFLIRPELVSQGLWFEFAAQAN